MSFESRVIDFSDRFLADRTFELVVAPALADLQFDPGTTLRSCFANRLAVLKAVAGGLGQDLKRELGGAVVLAMAPTCYYLCLLTVCFDALSSPKEVLSVTGLVAAMCLVLVAVCFWPSRRPRRSVD